MGTGFPQLQRARWVFATLISGCVLLASAGCRTTPTAPDRSTVAAELTDRFHQNLPEESKPGEYVTPPGASFDDGVTEDEAVAFALWNNAAFQELLADLGVAHGDLVQAGLLPNPEFLYFLGMTDKPFKYAFEFPIEALWLRPIRLDIAEHDADRTAARLAQAGIDLMRDVRQAYADAVLARDRTRVARQAVALRSEIAEFADKRLQAGDISPQEAATARIDALQAEQELRRVGFEIPITEERLRNLLGLCSLRTPIPLDPSPPPVCSDVDSEMLVAEALCFRPDAIAAAEAVEAAEARLELSRVSWFRLLGLGDGTSGRNKGREFGPATRFTVPIFNWNQGNITRADAELERAERNQHTVACQIALDVHRSALQFEQACAEMDVLLNRVRPELETAIVRAQKAYQEGQVTYLIVLETTRQKIDNLLREAQLQGDLRRFWAELERSVGRRIELRTPIDGGPETSNVPPAPSADMNGE